MLPIPTAGLKPCETITESYTHTDSCRFCAQIIADRTTTLPVHSIQPPRPRSAISTPTVRKALMSNTDSVQVDQSHLTWIALNTHDPRCQLCDHHFHEGDNITVDAYRLTDDPTDGIGDPMRGHDTHEHPTVPTGPTTSADPHLCPETTAPRTSTQPTQREPTPLLAAVRERARADGGLHEWSPEVMSTGRPHPTVGLW